MHVRPDGKALVTGSADKNTKFLEIETKTSDTARISFHSKNNVALVHIKTLKMTNDILVVEHSPDGRLLAVALLDLTVKVFY
ncbi:hypothetical protein BS47DRAFT_1466384 [Hydnum rufescens UP504]|uniref:Uncharacterized protein n=1 Tax=Hydnum rufescens UP504 TaxID=1448309 RepID=A0A9P6AAV0_9AGAM|nr:hypothetical protein BS47DRAFT_1466384 [Hydnum rufescens UP504]